jgi:hypothetical protein
MFKSILRDRLLISLALVSLLIKIFSLNPAWVERYYTFGLYPVISKMLRAIFGWIPFSVGDLVYAAGFIFFVLKAWKLIRLLAKRQVKEYLSWILFRKYLKLVFWIYIVFNIFWGLNYNRQGIAHQFGLNLQHFTPGDLYELTSALQQKLNFYAIRVDSVKRLPLNNNTTLFREGISAYKIAAKEYSFLNYQQPSIKPSLFANIGNYFGYTGYYNPFTGEAQLKTDVPVFTKPFIICHEMGHQLGYAKENEANFSSYLAGRVSHNVEFRYSVYYDMYSYAMSDLFIYNLPCFIELKKSEDPQVKKDIKTYRQYLLKTRNVIEPVMSLAYDRYLKINNQPNGKETYNEVVDWLIAYMKKYGKEAL